jgi:two-component system phosphate regulon sensor histidine kinase PhoR
VSAGGWAWGLAGAAAGLAAFAAARWLVLRRELANLAARLDEMGLGGRLDLRLPPSAEPSLSRITESANALVRRLAAQMEELAAGRARLQAVLDTMAEGILVLDAQGRIVTANPAAERLLGAPSLAAGVPLQAVARLPRLQEVAREAEHRAASAELETAGDPPRWLRVRAAPLGAAAAPGRVLAVLADVTDFKRLDQIRRDFIANASHELKTPLAAIRGYAEVLADETGTEESRVILRHAERLSRLVEDLLTLSRLESRSLDVRPTVLDVAAVAERAFALIRPLADARRVSLVSSVAAGTKARADEESLLRILLNLLDNAVKWSPEGGRVEILSAPAEAGIAVSVRDRGPGIAPEHLPRLFERFYRVDKARSRELGGTGLGLAIVKHLAELNGGEAFVRSRPGEGTEAGVRLPAAT